MHYVLIASARSRFGKLEETDIQYRKINLANHFVLVLLIVGLPMLGLAIGQS